MPHSSVSWSLNRPDTRIACLLAVLLGFALAGCGADGARQADGGGEQPDASTAADSGGEPDCDGGQSPGLTGTKSWEHAPDLTLDPEQRYEAVLETDAGTLRAELLPEEAPCAVNNFVFLAGEGFYDEVPFHRIVKGFMVQTGDPTGTGRGGPGYTITDDDVELDYERGVLAMANTGQPDSAGSQFFIVHQDAQQLPPTYAIFGRLVEGLDVLDEIASVRVTDNGAGEVSKPVKPVKLREVRIVER